MTPKINITKSGFIPDVMEYNDSMELDSAQDIIWAEGTIGDKYKFDACVRVCGDVRVIFKDETYKCASRMPKELLECYHNETNPEELALSEGEHKYETPYYADNNNWFEKIVRIYDLEGELVADNDCFASDNSIEAPKCYADTPEGFINSFISDVLELYSDSGLSKDSDNSHTLSADNIINDAQDKLTAIIKNNISKLTADDELDEDGNRLVSVDDYKYGKIRFKRIVFDLQTDYSGVEDRTISTIRMDDNDEIWLETEEEPDDEIELSELDTDEIAAIARWSEQAVSEG